MFRLYWWLVDHRSPQVNSGLFPALLKGISKYSFSSTLVSPGHLRVSLHISLHYSLLMSPSILYFCVPFSPSCFTSCTAFPLFPMYLNFPSSLKFLNVPRLASVCHPPVAVFSRRHCAAVICWVAVSLQCLWVFGLKPPSGRLLLADLRSRSPSASLHSLPRLWQRVAPPAGEQWDYRSATPHMDSHTFPLTFLNGFEFQFGYFLI